MTDLTKITTPFGLLEDEQPEVAQALRDAAEAGAPIEMWLDPNSGWETAHLPSFGFRRVPYRVKPTRRIRPGHEEAQP